MDDITTKTSDGNAQLRDFLSVLGFDPDALSGFEVRIIGPDRKARSWWPIRFDALTDIIETANAKGESVFFGVTKRSGRRGDKLHCVSAAALWADLDGKTFDAADLQRGKERARAELGKRLPGELQPAIIVDSGHGLHCYWPLREAFVFENKARVAEFEGVLRGLAAHLDGDAAVCDVAHVLRIPGSCNFKNGAEPRHCELKSFTAGRAFDIDDIPVLAPPKARAAPALFAEAPSVAPDDKVREGARNATLTKLGGAMRRQGAGGRAIAIALSLENEARCVPPLPAEEVLGIAASVAKYTPEPAEIGELEPTPAAAAALEERFEVRYINPVSHRVVKPPSHIADVLFPGYTVLYGPPKTGKTLVALAATLALHTGTALWGRAAEQTPCAWLELDMNEGAFQDYADRLAAGMEIPPRPLPYFAHGFIDLMDRRQQKALCAALRELGSRLLVIDSVRAASSIDENDSNAVRAFVRGFILHRLRNELGISVIAIAHSPKVGLGPRGSGEWGGAADSLWDVRRPAGTGMEILTVNGTGRHAPFTLSLELVIDALAARVIEVPGEEARKRVLGHQLEDGGVMAAARALWAATPGISQRALGAELRTQGFGFRQEKLRVIFETLQREGL